MLALAHRVQGGLLHETIVWAHILSMSRITTELNARIGPSGTWRPATRDCRVGLHTFNERDHYQARCSHRPIRRMVGSARGYRGGLHTFNEQDHYQAKCSHWPIGHM